MTHYDLAVIGTGSGNTIVDQAVRGLAGRDHRGEPLRRHLPQRRLHPDQDVRLPRRPRPRRPARARARRRHVVRRSPLAGDPGPHLRPDRPHRRERARPTASGCPTSTSTRSTPPSSTTTPSTPGAGEQITADQIVIAAGSRVNVRRHPRPRRGRLPHQRHGDAARRTCPRRMTIVGGGYVAAEFAHVFSALGTEVTQVHRGPALLREHDEDISAHVHRARRAPVGRAARAPRRRRSPRRDERRCCPSPTAASSRPTYS